MKQMKQWIEKCMVPARKKGIALVSALIIIAALGVPQIVQTSQAFMNVAIAAAEAAGLPEQNPSFPIAEDRAPRRTMWVLATAYSSDVAQTDSTPCIPANGYDLCAHYELYGSGNTIAANFLRFETQVRFPEVFGDKVFVARDRMNARYNGEARIDVWMPTREEAIQFGAQWIEMEIF